MTIYFTYDYNKGGYGDLLDHILLFTFFVK